jgi:hypothetical protein
MAGSKKGEHRGNAKRRPRARIHESPEEVMMEAAKTADTPGKRHDRTGRQNIAAVERRIQVARVINGDDGLVRNMTPKEVLLDNMWTFFQGAKDYQEMWRIAAAVQPPTEESIRACEFAEKEIERLRQMAGYAAFQVMPVVHPRLSAVAVANSTGESAGNVVQMLLDEIDKRSREAPLVLEHRPKKVGS